jgi:hypothetical protein
MMRRLPRIVGAYLAACAAGGFAITLALVLLALLEPLLQGRWPAASPPPSPAYLLLLATGLASLLAALYAFVPTAVVIVIGEVRGLRSPAFYSTAGAVSAIAAWGLLLGRIFPPTPSFVLAPGQSLLLFIVSAAGLVGGSIYWRIAGRTAGAWHTP